MNKPLVSVIVPVYNGERFLAEAVESIRRQNYEELEIIIVDDGSIDGTPRIISGLPVRSFRQENRGPSAARNRGLREACGEIIAFLDADDLWPEGKLALQLPRLLAEPELEIVLGRIKYLELDGAKKVAIKYENDEQIVTHIHLGSGLYRRRVFEQVGSFDEELRFSEDQDWFLRAREKQVKMTILKEVTLHYRIHGGNMTNSKTIATLDVMKVLKKSLARRRQNGGQLGNWTDNDEKRLVSVIIPVHNGAAYLGEALASVQAQNYRPLEIIVVDDGSTDGSAAVAKAVGVKYFYQEKSGAAAARNRGVGAARGNYLAFLDGDDLWSADKLACQVAELEQRPELDLVFGEVEEFVCPQAPAELTKDLRPLSGPIAGYHAGAMLIRRDSFHQAGLFPTDLKLGEFIDWFVKGREQGLTSAVIPGVVMRRRLHGANTVLKERAATGDYLKIVKATLDRRRVAK